VQPGDIVELEIDGLSDLPSEECYLELNFTLRESTNWAKSGHAVAFGQVQLVEAPSFEVLKGSPSAPQVKQVTPQLLSITSSNVQWKFNIVHGTLVSWARSGQELIHTPPYLDFYRAITDNDRPKFGETWTASRLHQTKCHVRSVSWTPSPTGVVVVVYARVAPPVLEWSVDTTFTYTFTSEHVSIKVNGKPRGENVPDTWARTGLTMGLNGVESATWFGRGPGESYRDKKLSQKIGNYTLPIEELLTNYEFPQETGNRTDTRWVSFNGKKEEPLLKAYFANQEEASFTALHYTTRDLDESQHPYELYKKKKEETIVRLDWGHQGLGTGSCGQPTLPQYQLKSGDFEYEVLLV